VERIKCSRQFMPAERGFQLCDLDRGGDSAMISSRIPPIDASMMLQVTNSLLRTTPLKGMSIIKPIFYFNDNMQV
jgi:hypothetical protein